MGVVIGATTEIGDDVTLYQGVTLGGTSLERGIKRHPTLANGVIVGAGAKVLGPITIGENARIGSNAVVVADVAAETTVVGVPAKAVRAKGHSPQTGFLAYGTPENIPDPVAKALKKIGNEAIEKAEKQSLEIDNDMSKLLTEKKPGRPKIKRKRGRPKKR